MSKDRNDINELREHLFATLRGVRDKENPMDIDRAKAVVLVAGALIDTARVEVDYVRVTGDAGGSTFIVPGNLRLSAASPDAPDPSLVSRRVHRLQG